MGVKLTAIFRGQKDKKTLYLRYRLSGGKIERTFRTDIEGYQEQFDKKKGLFELRGNYSPAQKEINKQSNAYLERLYKAWGEWCLQNEMMGCTHFSTDELVSNESYILTRAKGDCWNELERLGNENDNRVASYQYDVVYYRISETYKELIEGKSVTKSTITSYIAHLKPFASWLVERSIDSYQFLTEQTIRDYTNHLLKDGLSKNSVKLFLSSVKQLAKVAFENGYLRKESYLAVKNAEITLPKSSKSGNHIAITTGEIEALYALKSLTPLQEKVRDIFLVCATTAQRWSDIVGLDCSEESTTARLLERDGNRVLLLTQKKTLKEVGIPLFSPITYDILKKWDFKLPQMPYLATYNNLLKEICKICGGTFNDTVIVTESKGGKTTKRSVPRYELITSHTGRRTGVSNLLDKFDVLTTMKISGHSTAQIVALYDKRNGADFSFNLFK